MWPFPANMHRTYSGGKSLSEIVHIATSSGEQVIPTDGSDSHYIQVMHVVHEITTRAITFGAENASI